MKKNSATGTYVYDEKTGKVVQVSDDIPKSKKRRSSPAPMPPRGACGNGGPCGNC